MPDKAYSSRVCLASLASHRTELSPSLTLLSRLHLIRCRVYFRIIDNRLALLTDSLVITM